MLRSVDVPRWQPHDFAFSSTTEHDNPFLVPFGATVTGPSGDRFTIPGFYDGNHTWKVRISPYEEGTWTVRTISQDRELDGKEASFRCVPNRSSSVHGGLRVDPEHPHHFVFEDGARYFTMGYECDWLWALDANDPNLPTISRFLDKLASYGFNQIILNVYAHDCGWRRGRTGPDDYGPPLLFPWEGTNGESVEPIRVTSSPCELADHSRFNLAFWEHYDRAMDALLQRGIIAYVMIKVYNKMVTWPAKGSPEDDLYFRHVIARYAAYPNVVWCFSKESNNEPDLAYKLDRFRFIRENDPYHRLLTTHDDEQVYRSGQYDQVLDFHSDQHHSDWHAETLRKRAMRAWPIYNVEFGYEHGPGGMDDKTYGVVQPPEEVCRRAWVIVMAGGHVAYYYTYTAWDVIRPDDTPKGYEYFRLLRGFFEDTGYWRMSPADELVSEGYCLAEPGVEYVVFLYEGKPFSLDVGSPGRSFRGEWFDPFSGRRVDAGSLSGETVRFVPPDGWAGRPIALHVRSH